MHTPRQEPDYIEQPIQDVDAVDGERAASGYSPPHDAEPIPLATQRPRVKTLDKTKVAIIVGVLALAIGFAFLQAFMPKDKTKGAPQDSAQANATPGEALNRLPGDYSKLAEQRANAAPQLGPAMPGELGGMELAHQRDLQAQAAVGDPNGYNPNQTAYAGQGGQMTPVQQYEQQLRMERLQAAANARKSPPTFGGASAGFGGVPSAATLSEPSPLDALKAQLAQVSAIPPGLGGGGPASNKADRDEANRQDDKQAFADNKDLNTAQLDSHLIPAPVSVISAGTMISALFITGVNSDLPGLLTAQVSQPVYDSPNGRHILIPQGTRLIGQYDSRVTYGQSRVLLVWHRLVFPNGASLSLEGMPGVDMSGYSGVRDKVNNHWGKIAGAVILSTTLATATAATKGDTYSVTNPSLSQQAAQAAGGSINQAGQKLVDRAINVQPTLLIRPGQRVGVLVSKDLILPPYSP